MVTYGQYCPVAKAAEVVGERWTLLVLREVSYGPAGFNALTRGLPGMSRSVLSDRLRSLQRAGVVRRRGPTEPRAGAYELTAAGRDLMRVVHDLGEWAATWVFGDPLPSEADADLLVLFVSRNINPSALPARRVVVAIELTGRVARRYWLVVDRGEVSVCRTDPGFPVDVHVQADVLTLYRVCLGRLALADALVDEAIQVTGSGALVRSFARWCPPSTFAPAVRAAARRRGVVAPA